MNTLYLVLQHNKQLLVVPLPKGIFALFSPFPMGQAKHTDKIYFPITKYPRIHFRFFTSLTRNSLKLFFNEHSSDKCVFDFCDSNKVQGRVFIKYCFFSLKFCDFLNSASSAAALVFYLPSECTNTDTERKKRKERVRNILKSSKKHNI